jgi:ArsR family transcriptional regulator
MDSAEFLDLLGNANRRRILRLLAQKPCYVTEISEQLGVSPKAVIDHLQKLEDAGLVESRTDDRRRKYFSISQHVSLEVTVSPYEFGTRSAYPSNSRLDITSCRQVSVELESLTVRSDGTDSGEKSVRSDGTDSGEQGGETAERTTGTVEPRVEGGSPAATDGDASVTNPSSTTAADRGSETGPESESDRCTGSENEEPAAGTDPATLARQLHDFEQLERELSLVHRWAEGRITDLRERLSDRVEVADPRLVSELLVELAGEPRQIEELGRRLGVPPAVVEELLDVLASEDIVRREGRTWTLAD